MEGNLKVESISFGKKVHTFIILLAKAITMMKKKIFLDKHFLISSSISGQLKALQALGIVRIDSFAKDSK